MPWIILALINSALTTTPENPCLNNIKKELDRLNKQRCSTCTGYGHSVKHCPTHVKLCTLRVGVREQRALVDKMLKAARKAVAAVPVAQ